MRSGRPRKLVSIQSLQEKAIDWCELLYLLSEPHPLMLVLREPHSLSSQSKRSLRVVPLDKVGRSGPPRYKAAFLIPPGQEKTASRDFSKLLEQGWEFAPSIAVWKDLNLAAQQDFWHQLNSGSPS